MKISLAENQDSMRIIHQISQAQTSERSAVSVGTVKTRKNLSLRQGPQLSVAIDMHVKKPHSRNFT